MPDPLYKTVSASQIAALFGKSPYLTNWMLWHNFKERIHVDNVENDRMAWGKRLEWPILQATADELRLEITPTSTYERREGSRIGCTRDAIVMDPQRGLGAAEAKNVDYGRWKENWTDTTAPAHIEMQLQAQMYVGDGKAPFTWGVISCLIGGNDLRILPREPMPDLWAEFEAAAAAFFQSIDDNDEPDAFGSGRELEILDKLFPAVKPAKEIDLREAPEGEALADCARQWQIATNARLFHKKLEDQCKARLMAAAHDAETLKLPGVNVKIKKSQTAPSIVRLSDQVCENLAATIDRDNPDQLAAAKAAIDFEAVTRKGSVRTVLDIYEYTPAADPLGLAKFELYEIARGAQAPLDHDIDGPDGHSDPDEGAR